MKHIKNIISLIIIVFLNCTIKGQDPHFSQFDVSPIILNPSYTGMDEGIDSRAVAQLRSSWNTSTTQMTTTSFAFDMPFERFGFGGFILNDDGSRAFNSFNFIASGAYRITDPNQQKIKLTVGLQAGILYKSIKEDELLFENQYNGGNFDPDLPSGESFETYSRIMPDANFGFSYQGFYNKGATAPYAGFAINHVTYPKESFYNDADSRLPLKYIANIGSKFEINEYVTVDPKAYFFKQRNSMEIYTGVSGYYQFGVADFRASTSVYYRWGDAVIAVLGYSYKNFSYLVSYDFTVSELKNYTNPKGVLEFTVVFANTRTKGRGSWRNRSRSRSRF